MWRMRRLPRRIRAAVACPCGLRPWLVSVDCWLRRHTAVLKTQWPTVPARASEDGRRIGDGLAYRRRYNWQREFAKWVPWEKKVDVTVLGESGSSMLSRTRELQQWYVTLAPPHSLR